MVRGSEDGELLGKFDVIIGADVVYWEHLFPLLLKTLEVIYQPIIWCKMLIFPSQQDTSDDNTVIFIAWVKRRAGDKGFFRQARKKFVCEPIQVCLALYIVLGNHSYLSATVYLDQHSVHIQQSDEKDESAPVTTTQEIKYKTRTPLYSICEQCVCVCVWVCGCEFV